MKRRDRRAQRAPAPTAAPVTPGATVNNRDERQGERRRRDRHAAARKEPMRPPNPPPHARQDAEEAPPESGPQSKRPTIRYVVGELPRIVQEALSALRADDNLFQAAGRLMTVVREPTWGWEELNEPELCERRASLDVECPACAASAGAPCVREHRAGSAMKRRPGTARMSAIAPAVLMERLANVAAWTRLDKEGEEIPANPNKVIVDIVHQREDWPDVRPIRAVIEAPALRPNWTVIETPGYDAATGYYYAPSAEFPHVPEQNTQKDAAAAMRRLWIEMFCDFPYRDMPEPDPTDHDRSRRYQHARTCPDAFVGIASLLTILARPAVKGAVPSFAFEAASQGSGKTKQIHAIATIATGRPAGVATFPMRNGRPNDEETEKILAGYALGGASIIAFDNVRGTLGGSALEKAQTAEETIDLRVLGFTGQKTLPWSPVLMVSGNNMAMTSDTADRTLVSRLESSREDPRSRPPSEFRHTNLLAALRQRRPALIRDALIILRAYALATPTDKTAMARDCGTLGSFEAWAALIPRVIRYAGGPNVLDARNRADASDSEGAAHETLMRHWPSSLNAAGVRASELIRHAFAHEIEIQRGNREPDGLDDLRGAIRELTATPAGKAPNPVTFANDVLRALRGKWRDGMKLVGQKDRKGFTIWRVEQRNPPRAPIPPPPPATTPPTSPPTSPPLPDLDIERDAIQDEHAAAVDLHTEHQADPFHATTADLHTEHQTDPDELVTPEPAAVDLAGELVTGEHQGDGANQGDDAEHQSDGAKLLTLHHLEAHPDRDDAEPLTTTSPAHPRPTAKANTSPPTPRNHRPPNPKPPRPK